MCGCGIVLFCGVPGSGKSTVASWLGEALRASGYDARVLEYDAVYEARFAEKDPAAPLVSFDPDTWRETRHQAVERLRDAIAGGSDRSARRVFLVDDVFYYRSMRYVFYRLAREFQCGFAQVHVRVPLEVALSNNSRRTGLRRVDEDVIRRMTAQFEAPEPADRHWERNSIVFDNPPAESIADVLASRFPVSELKEYLQQPVPPLPDTSAEKEASRQATLKSIAHQMDIRSRRIVAKLIEQKRQEARQDELSTFAVQLSAFRKHFLSNISTTEDAQISLTALREDEEAVLLHLEAVFRRQFAAFCLHK